MAENKHKIVSMLTSEDKLTLYTVEGKVLVMKKDGPHNIEKLFEFLIKKIDGKSAVDVDLNEYLSIQNAIVPDGYKSQGIIITQIIDGVEVQGIFYPSKMSVTVEHEGEQVTIPKVENLQKHANRANEENSPAVRNFLRRIAPVVKTRLHSAEDLMDFIKNSELPLTNDGLIIGYKKVNQKANGMFVDVHSGKIEQQVGSQVWMEADKVDPSRVNSCSNGLHVANLGYLKGFSGSHTLIVLVDPADFIAVPHREYNKARVCSYNVIGVMTARNHELLSSGSYIQEDQTFASLISDAVAGRFVAPFERIQVGDKCILSRTNMEGASTASAIELEEATAETKKSSGQSLNTIVDTPESPKKDIIKMAKTANGKMPWTNAPAEVINAFTSLLMGVSKAKTATAHNTSTRTLGRWEEKYDYAGWVEASKGSMTKVQQARMHFNNAAWQTLAEFKRQAKKSWTALGFNSKEITQIEQALA